MILNGQVKSVYYYFNLKIVGRINVALKDFLKILTSKNEQLMVDYLHQLDMMQLKITPRLQSLSH